MGKGKAARTPMRKRKADAGEQRMAQLLARRDAQFKARQSAAEVPQEPTWREFAHSVIDHPGAAARAVAHDIVDHPVRATLKLAVGVLIAKIIRGF